MSKLLNLKWKPEEGSGKDYYGNASVVIDESGITKSWCVVGFSLSILMHCKLHKFTTTYRSGAYHHYVRAVSADVKEELAKLGQDSSLGATMAAVSAKVTLT